MYLYRGWDEALYLTCVKEGDEGFICNIDGSTTIAALNKHLEMTDICAVIDAYFNGANDIVEIYK